MVRMVGQRSSRRVKPRSADDLTMVEIETLKAFARFHYLTAEHIIRLWYKPGNRTTVQTRLKTLVLDGFLERRPLPIPAPRREGKPVPLSLMPRGGSGAYLYTLGTKGRSVVDALGLEVPTRFRPSEIPKTQQLAHLVACSDVYVSAYLLSERHESLTLERLIVERTLKGMGKPVRVDDREQRVTPDGFWSVISQEGSRRFRNPFILEVDLSTERQEKWRAKVRALLAWWDNPQYEQLFGTTQATFAVISPGRERHAQTLRLWTEAELTELGRRNLGEQWLFTGANPATLDVDAFFPGRIWRQAFGEEPVAALEVGVVHA
jgi:hypothetical protein